MVTRIIDAKDCAIPFIPSFLQFITHNESAKPSGQNAIALLAEPKTPLESSVFI